MDLIWQWLASHDDGGMLRGKTPVNKERGNLMRFDTHQHPFYCGTNLHARSMPVCIMSHDGAIVLHRNMKAGSEAFLSQKIAALLRGGMLPPAYVYPAERLATRR
jgi:hypothetical protein